MNDPLIIQCAVTGSADPDPPRRPNLPVTSEQIIEEAFAAWRAFPTVLHLHAREDDGSATQDRAAFERLVEGVRAAGCDAVLSLSTGTAGGRSERDDRLQPLELEPRTAEPFDQRQGFRLTAPEASLTRHWVSSTA
jgi:3-keto-5-aminohexanoate cleavage enzyme